MWVTSFRKSDFAGNVLPGNVHSGKVTSPVNIFLEKVTFWETTANPINTLLQNYKF